MSTYIDDINNLPAHRAQAARALYLNQDERTVADAVHAHVPMPIVSFLSGMSAQRVRETVTRVDDRDMAFTGT
jgi:hypothetical protein